MYIYIYIKYLTNYAYDWGLMINTSVVAAVEDKGLINTIDKKLII